MNGAPARSHVPQPTRNTRLEDHPLEGREHRRPDATDPANWGWDIWNGVTRHNRVAGGVKGSLLAAEGGLAGFVEETARHLGECEESDERFPKLQAAIRMVAALDDGDDPDVAAVRTLLGLGGFSGVLAQANTRLSLSP